MVFQASGYNAKNEEEIQTVDIVGFLAGFSRVHGRRCQFAYNRTSPDGPPRGCDDPQRHTHTDCHAPAKPIAKLTVPWPGSTYEEFRAGFQPIEKK